MATSELARQQANETLAPAPLRPLQGRMRALRRWKDHLAQVIFLLSALSAIASIVLIFIFVGREALPVFWDPSVKQEASLSKLVFSPQTGPQANPFVWQPVSAVPKYSLVPLLMGTLKATFVALITAVPLALLAALYTSEFASRRWRELIKPAVELLAGIPSVVLGFFALMVLASLFQRVFHFSIRLNAITAGVALGWAVIPIIYSIAEDTLRAVPMTYREASLALGATPWQTVRRVVLPAALPGVAAAIALGFGRAVGETMIVLMASGNAAISSWDLTLSLRTLTATIGAEMAEVVFGSPHYHVLFFIGSLLFVVTFMSNLVGDIYLQHLRRKLQGVV